MARRRLSTNSLLPWVALIALGGCYDWSINGNGDGGPDSSVGSDADVDESDSDGATPPYPGEECYDGSECWYDCAGEGDDVNLAVCAGECPDSARYCWESCWDQLIVHEDCAPICGLDSPQAQAGCWHHCDSNGETTTRCEELCGLDSSCGEAECAGSCRTNELDPSTCKSICGFTTDLGTGHCYVTCLGNTSASECRALCGGAGTTCGESGCWSICRSDMDSSGLELGECTSTCGLQTACGRARCYYACNSTELSFSDCREMCGFEEGACDCLVNPTVREACMDVCGEKGETLNTCDGLCQP